MATKAWDRQFEKCLINSRGSRAFLSLFFEKEPSWKSPRPLTFGVFAQRAGFASKSFIHDVMSGRKRITPASFQKVVSGLGLNRTWAEFFRALLAIEDESFRTPGQKPRDFEEKLISLQSKIAKRLQSSEHSQSDPLVRVYLEAWFPEIYAALGELEVGADLETIVSRVRMNHSRVSMALKKMEKVGIVSFNNKLGKYLPSAVALDVDGLGKSEVFRSDFLRSIEKAKARFAEQAQTQNALFMTQTFSVSSADLPRLKMELADLLRNYSSDAEAPNGNCIAEVVVAFTNTLGPAT